MRWLSPEEVDKEAFRLRLLVIGHAKVGKTTSCIVTSPGPVGVLLADDDSGLRETRRQCIELEKPNHYKVFSIRNMGFRGLLATVEDVKREAEKKRVKTLVVDNLPAISSTLEIEALGETKTVRGEDGRRAYPLYDRRMMKIVSLLLEVKANVIVISHYIQPPEPSVDPKSGAKARPTPEDALIVPLLATKKARAMVPAMFTDIIYMGYDPRKNRRYFLTGPRGAITGPGCRSLRTTVELRADVGRLLRAFERPPLPAGDALKPKIQRPTDDEVAHVAKKKLTHK